MKIPCLLIVTMFIASWSCAETIVVPGGIAIKEASVVTPERGMSMDQVAAKFGTPVSKIPAVGVPPISRWEYVGFTVYFESDHVVHTVVTTS